MGTSLRLADPLADPGDESFICGLFKYGTFVAFQSLPENEQFAFTTVYCVCFNVF